MIGDAPHDKLKNLHSYLAGESDDVLKVCTSVIDRYSVMSQNFSLPTRF
jgi:hypothetical protein